MAHRQDLQQEATVEFSVLIRAIVLGVSEGLVHAGKAGCEDHAGAHRLAGRQIPLADEPLARLVHLLDADEW